MVMRTGLDHRTPRLRWSFWLVPLVALSWLGCKDPYSNKPTDFPPPVESRDKRFGSSQQVYQEPTSTRKEEAKPTGPVSRTPIEIDKSYIYGDPEASISIVEFSDFE